MPKRKRQRNDSNDQRENDLSENISRLVDAKNRSHGYNGNESDSLLHAIKYDLPTTYNAQFLKANIRGRRTMKSNEFRHVLKSKRNQLFV